MFFFNNITYFFVFNIFMKKHLLLLLFSPMFCFSQIGSINYIRASLGLEKNGYAASVGFDTAITPESFLRFGLDGEEEKYSFKKYKIPVKVGLLNVSFFQRLFSLDYEEMNNIFFGGGLLGGYESINNGKKILNNNEKILSNSKFIYGLIASTQLHLLLFSTWHNNQKAFLTLEIGYNYLINSDIESIQPFIKSGFKFNL